MHAKVLRIACFPLHHDVKLTRHEQTAEYYGLSVAPTLTAKGLKKQLVQVR